ncbi:SRPBCC family protein [Undibacterium sp. Ji67W]|uniref:SRPBCC family protein n=1 Tax=Undibacterium sp. Ji67W TaxID=3413042 RepID=UPI003BEFF8BA
MSYALDVEILSESCTVMDAIATSEGISGWWTKTNAVSNENGIELLFVDFGAVKKIIKVNSVEPLSQIKWEVLECTLSEWEGTTITLKVMPMGAGKSLLKLVHSGLTPDLECFESCSFGWKYFMNSLKQYVETGKGTPY